MSSELFAGMPSINIPRSKWQNGYNLPMTFKHGKLIALDAIPILPGDGLALRMSDITWMQTPIAPLFGNIKQHFAAFFVPMRLVWDNTEIFFGANKTGAGPQTVVKKIPHATFNVGVQAGSLSHYLGKPLCATGDVDGDNKQLVANILKERCYYLIYNEYFRAQQIQNPMILKTGDASAVNNVGSEIGTINGVYINPGDASTSLMSVCKEFDYFTASTISPQYGSAVELPLGTVAPLTMGAKYNIHDADSNGYGVPYLGNLRVDDNNNLPLGYTANQNSSTTTGATESNIYVDLSTAVAAKINDIRYAFAVQKYLERANFSGNYFFGILQVHYGVTSPDSRLQRPEFLGEFTEDILVQQVISTADTVNSGVQTPVGAPGAKSCTPSGTFSLFNKAFVEPGYVVILRWCRQRQLYSGGILREDMKRDRFEIYTPELCNLGDQATKTKEIYWKAKDSDIFGYQEHWAEYRFRHDRVSGLLDPYNATGLPYWTLAHKFTSKPELNDTFIKENADDIDRALTTGSSIDEYISDTYLELIFTREMPVRTMPGLIDHFGAW